MAIKETLFDSITSAVINKYYKGAVLMILKVFGPIYHVACQWVQRVFLDTCLTTFSESVISKIPDLRGSSIFSKCSKCQLEFKNAEKNW